MLYLQQAGLGNTGKAGNQQNKIILPSVRVKDLVICAESPLLSPEGKKKIETQIEQTNVKKFLTKSLIVVTALLTAGSINPARLCSSLAIKGKLPELFFNGLFPLIAGVSAGGAVSIISQQVMNGKTDKKLFISDLKDAFITASIVHGLSNIVMDSGKFFSSFGKVENYTYLTRFKYNGLIGMSYALMRGIIKPDKEDKISAGNLANGFIEGIFLGEGAKLLYHTKIGQLPANPFLNKIITNSKLVVGAAVGSMAFRSVQLLGQILFNPHKSIDQKFATPQSRAKEILKDFFHGNSYPTKII